MTGSHVGISSSSCRDKVPPVDAFNGESPMRTGYQRFSVLQSGMAGVRTRYSFNWQVTCMAVPYKWGLLSSCEKESLEEATKAMHNFLDPCSRTLAAQDFRHASESDNEPSSDDLSGCSSWCRDGMSNETRGMLLHSQLQEGLHYEIMKAPDVSGSHGTKSCVLLQETRRSNSWS